MSFSELLQLDGLYPSFPLGGYRVLCSQASAVSVYTGSDTILDRLSEHVPAEVLDGVVGPFLEGQMSSSEHKDSILTYFKHLLPPPKVERDAGDGDFFYLAGRNAIQFGSGLERFTIRRNRLYTQINASSPFMIDSMMWPSFGTRSPEEAVEHQRQSFASAYTLSLTGAGAEMGRYFVMYSRTRSLTSFPSALPRVSCITCPMIAPKGASLFLSTTFLTMSSTSSAGINLK